MLVGCKLGEKGKALSFVLPVYSTVEVKSRMQEFHSSAAQDRDVFVFETKE